MIQRLIPWAGGLFISAIFIDSLRFKFAGHPTPRHIFETSKEWSGIGLFYPASLWIIGLGELTASILLVVAPLVLLALNNKRLADLSQFGGALIAIGIMSGAIFSTCLRRSALKPRSNGRMARRRNFRRRCFIQPAPAGFSPRWSLSFAGKLRWARGWALALKSARG